MKNKQNKIATTFEKQNVCIPKWIFHCTFLEKRSFKKPIVVNNEMAFQRISTDVMYNLEKLFIKYKQESKKIPI